MMEKSLSVSQFNRFQVYGQRCSGTNALIRLIEANFDTLTFTEEFGFKHWLVPETREFADDVFVIVIAREVGQWLRSLHRRPWHAHPELKSLDFADFIRAPWRTQWDTDFWGIDEAHPKFGMPIAEELCPRTQRPFANPVAMRAAKLRNWRSTSKRAAGHMLLSHSELLTDPEEVVRRVAEATGAERRGEFVPVATYKGQGIKTFVFERYPELSHNDTLHVAEHADPAIEQLFGLPVPAGKVRREA